jgi:SAM-dependent methyltransferase
MDLLQIGLRRVDVFFLPFRTIGHFVTRDERQRVFKQVFDCLAPGGRFVFDHYVPDLDWARENQSRPLQMFKAAQSADLEIWDTYQFDFNRGLMNCFVEIRRNNSGTADAQLQGAAGRSTVAFTFSWLATDEVREIAAATGFEVESLYGDFDEGPFNAQSEQQIWVLRRPLEDVR